jgi:hypothetical protein
MARTPDPQFLPGGRFLLQLPRPHAFGDEAAHLGGADIQGGDDIGVLGRPLARPFALGGPETDH